MSRPASGTQGFSLSQRMARWGVVIVMIYVLAALLVPVLLHLGWLDDPNAGLDNPIYAPPSPSHWCGTDRLGRDVCTRTLAGSGVALQVVVVALLVALLIGVPLGMASGYLGGAVDRVLVLLMDTLYTLPVLLLSVVLAFLPIEQLNSPVMGATCIRSPLPPPLVTPRQRRPLCTGP